MLVASTERSVVAADHAHPFDPEGVERARAAQLTAEQASRLSDVLSLIGEPVRARVICALLAVDELCVADVALSANVNHDAGSYALRTLLAAGLVERRRDGRLNYYRLADHDTQPSLRTALSAVLDIAESGAVVRGDHRQ